MQKPFDANYLRLSPKFVGVGTAKFTFPCHHCEMHYKDDGKLENETMLKGGKLKDLKSISDYAKQYLETLRNHKGKNKVKFCPLLYL